MSVIVIPDDDGVTHLNIGSQAKTWLGRELAHCAHRSFSHYEHGRFASVEGYSQWLSRQAESLRELCGPEATKAAKNLPIVKRWSKELFQQHINVANASKIHEHPDIKDALIKSVLPLEQYCVIHVDGEITIKHAQNNVPTLAYIEGLRREENPEADIHHLHRLLDRFEHVRHLA